MDISKSIVTQMAPMILCGTQNKAKCHECGKETKEEEERLEGEGDRGNNRGSVVLGGGE